MFNLMILSRCYYKSSVNWVGMLNWWSIKIFWIFVFIIFVQGVFRRHHAKNFFFQINQSFFCKQKRFILSHDQAIKLGQHKVAAKVIILFALLHPSNFLLRSSYAHLWESQLKTGLEIHRWKRILVWLSCHTTR